MRLGLALDTMAISSTSSSATAHRMVTGSTAEVLEVAAAGMHMVGLEVVAAAGQVQ
jgi:hypothetical protein